MIKKSSLLFFVVLIGIILFLYNIFPLGIDKNTTENQVVVEEEDPMTGNTVTTVVSEQSNVKENDIAEEDKKDLDEEKKKKQAEKKRKKEEEERKKREEEEQNKTSKVDEIIKFAKSKVGKPYGRAGTTDKGYDCSGLIMVAYKNKGIKLPRASYNMARRGMAINLKDVKKGDLLFFATEKKNRINHVGMVTGISENRLVYFVHSTDKAGVIVNTLRGFYKNKFVKAKRYIK